MYVLFELQKHTCDIKMTYKVIRQASKCDKCVARKSTLLKKKSSKDPDNLRLLILRAK